MSNKYLEKIADFDHDAHKAMVDTAAKNKAHPGGWQGNMDKFKSVSKRSMEAAAKPTKMSLLSKITKFIK